MMTWAEIEQALCRQADPDAWFPEGVGNRGLDAKAICRRCPFRLPCLITAIEDGEKLGIRGGFGEDVRRKITVATAADAIRADDELDAQRKRDTWVRTRKHNLAQTEREKWMRRCHTAYNAGKRDEDTVAGEREYNRLRKRKSLQRARAA